MGISDAVPAWGKTGWGKNAFNFAIELPTAAGNLECEGSPSLFMKVAIAGTVAAYC